MCTAPDRGVTNDVGEFWGLYSSKRDVAWCLRRSRLLPAFRLVMRSSPFVYIDNWGWWRWGLCWRWRWHRQEGVEEGVISISSSFVACRPLPAVSPYACARSQWWPLWGKDRWWYERCGIGVEMRPPLVIRRFMMSLDEIW